MFRRLAESFQNIDTQSNFIEQQTKFYSALPNAILSGTSGLNGFDKAIQSVDAYGRLENLPVKSANNIFIEGTSPSLDSLAQQCASSSIDELLAIKNPSAAVGCGWMYSPPPQGSPYPKKSQGFIGNKDGPLEAYNPSSDYKKWYFDLQIAKKQQLLDKCKALKACTDLDSEVFKGSCGFCTDTNQGVPIDSVGKPLYGNDPIGACNTASVVTNTASCPVPTPTSGPQPIVDRTCEPRDGRLSADCLYKKLLTAGCSDNGSLAVALANPSSPSDYISKLSGSDVVKIYNRVANPPLNLNVFSQGAATIDIVLKEARQLAANATKADVNTALGAAARDLCLQSGAINKFDFCSDLSDTSTPPFDIECLQKLFRKMGGQPSGNAYPSVANLTNYNSMGTLGAIKQYWSQIAGNMKSADYGIQRDAMIQFLGIKPETFVKRAPYVQGVEVIWLMPRGGYPNTIWGVLKRTIEPNIIQYSGGSRVIPQLASTYPGFSQYVTMIQMFDLRATGDFSTRFRVTVDDGFFIAVNEKPDIATKAFTSLNVDQVGLFSNLQLQGPTMYMSKNCSNYSATTPNITKIYFSDAGGGGSTFQVTPIVCSGQSSFLPAYYSLTLDRRAPYLNFEVNQVGDSFDDTRNPGLYSSLVVTRSLEFHNRTDERHFVPGKKGFVRIANGSGQIILQNIAYQAWGTMTFAFRLQTMPVKDTIFAFKVWNKFCYLYVVPVNGNTAQLYVQTNMTQNGTVFDGPTKWSFQLGNWYFLEVAQTGDGFDLYCDLIENIIRAGNFTTGGVWKITNNGPITTTQNNGLYLNGQIMCHYYVGGSMSGSGFFSSSFQFDLAWIHFYDYYINAADVVKDCQAAWAFTQFPDSLNTYKTME
jgi:hypothetical protein